VEIDRIFVGDGHIWTSAGMTAGIDLALALLERDIGPEKTREAARVMVVHHRRAGGQSQHSALLEIDAKSDRVQDALQYARRNLSKPLSVENLRLEAARLMLEQGRLPVETVACTTGFGDRERMRRSFVRVYGRTPQSIRNASSPLMSF
jgi:transcriptional regulator GlxA family with amidase domain